VAHFYFSIYKYVTNNHASIYKSIKLVDSSEAFIRFKEKFDVVGVRWSEPTTISASYFLRLLQDGASAKAHIKGSGNDMESDEASFQMNEFYTTLLDHGVLWKLKDGGVICTAMPYGDKSSIIEAFQRMIKTYDYPSTLKMEFLSNQYRFCANGDHMIVIFCESSNNNYSQDLSDNDLRNKAIQHSSSGQLRSQTTTAYVRDRYVSEYAKQRANGICQLCDKPAPFNDYDGKPYLETHHIVWLSKGGEDSIENTIALCPNCHKKMHILNLEKDVEKLIKVAKKQRISET